MLFIAECATTPRWEGESAWEIVTEPVPRCPQLKVLYLEGRPPPPPLVAATVWKHSPCCPRRQAVLGAGSLVPVQAPPLWSGWKTPSKSALRVNWEAHLHPQTKILTTALMMAALVLAPAVALLAAPNVRTGSPDRVVPVALADISTGTQECTGKAGMIKTSMPFCRQ